MKFKILSAKLTSSPDASGWAQVHDYTPEDPEQLKSRGRLIAILGATLKSQGIDTISAGREILSRLHEEYYGNQTATPFNGLRAAVEKVVREFSNGDQVEIGALVLVKRVLYLAVGGGVEAVVLRNQGLAKILESQSGQTISASGHPQDQDLYLLGTQDFFRVFSQEKIKEALIDHQPQAGVENLAPDLHQREDSGSVGVVLVKFEQPGIIPQVSQKEESPTAEPHLDWKKAKPVNRMAQFLNRANRFLPARRIIVGQETRTLEGEKNRKVAITVGLILLILLGVSIFFGVKQQRAKQTRSRYEDQLVQAQHEFEEAQSLVSLNPARARELILSSQSIAQELKNQGINDPELNLLLKDVQEGMGQIAGIYEIEPELFLDLSLISSGFQADEMTFSDGRMLVLDKNGKRLVSIEAGTKKTKLIAGPDQLYNPQKVAVYADRDFVANNQGIYEVENEADLVIEGDWAGEILLQAYTGNIYLLDKGDSQIYRYSGTTSGFGSKQKWFGPGTEPDLNQAVSWSIDGSIWVLLNGGIIKKFSYGKPDSFSINGNISQAKAIFTDEELEDLYILDPANKRILVTDKNGEFKAEYKNDQIQETEQIAVSQTDKKIILLTKDKLYSIEAKHMVK